MTKQGKDSRKGEHMPEKRGAWLDGRDILGYKKALHHIDAGLLHTINESEKSVLFHEVNVFFQNRFRFTDSSDLTVMHPHNSVAELFKGIQTV